MFFCQSANDMRVAVAKADNFCYTKDVILNFVYTDRRRRQSLQVYHHPFPNFPKGVAVKKASELKKLRREDRALRRRIRTLEQQGAGAAPVEHPNDAAAFDAGNYFSYLLARLRQKSLFARAEKITRYFRSSMWVTRLFRYGMLIYQYLQAGAFVILYTALFILIIPILLSLSLATLVVTLILRKKNADKLIAACTERGSEVRFVLIPVKEDFDAAALRAEAAKTPEASVLIVSPFFFRRCGIGKSEDMYVCYRGEGGNAVILRKYFFFYLRRRMRHAEYFSITETVFAKPKEDTETPC